MNGWFSKIHSIHLIRREALNYAKGGMYVIPIGDS